jgi:hypothetical protein
MRIGDELVTALELVNGATIVQESPAEVEYWHIELDRHSVILAEGAQAETYVDTGNRSAFENAAVVMLNPALDGTVPDPCLPYAGASHAIRERLITRAEEIGWTHSIDPTPWLEVDGQHIEPSPHENGYRFTLRPDSGQVRLRSRAGRPWDVDPHSGDRRQLGLKLHRLALSGPGGVVEVSMDSLSLNEGFNRVERDAEGRLCRWTTGDTLLPLAELAPGQDVTVVEIAFDQALPMWVEPHQAASVNTFSVMTALARSTATPGAR